MMDTPVDFKTVNDALIENEINDLSIATIREIVQLVSQIEHKTNVKFIRMEMGVPGLPAPEVGVNAEIEALRKGVASLYPILDGLPELKKEASDFVKNFLNIHIQPGNCIPTSGSMQGGYAAFLICSNLDPKKDTALFIDPGFSVQKQQFMVMGHKYTNFDVYEYRGQKLRDKLESILCKGNINSIIYSNPNNPSWICFNEQELQIIAEMANKYNVIVIEDLAYFGMDFRNDISKPGIPPFQPTVANYTNNYLLLISSSKAFSYAGQRVSLLCVSNELFKRSYPYLNERFHANTFGHALVHRILYCFSAGTSHSAQYALAAMLHAANQGSFNFVEELKYYGKKAQIMKKIFLENGFQIVYDKDLDKELADGFYFTIAYPGMDSGELLKNLLYYGISAISLKMFGSDSVTGMRACVSQVKEEQFGDFEERIKRFNKDFPIK